MSTLTYFYLKYKIYSLSSRLHNMYTPNKRSPLVKIHSDYVKDSFAKTVMSILIFVFFLIVHSREYQSTECWVVLIPQIHFFLSVQLQEYQLNWCWFNHFKNGFYLFLHMKSSGSGKLSHPYSPLAGSSLSAVGMEVKGCEGQRRGHTQAPGAPGVRHRTDQRRPWLLLESMVGSRERRSWTDGAQHSVFCWRGEAGRRESILSLLSWLIKSLSNAVPSLTNALIPMTHTNVCLPLLSVPFGGVSMLLACLLPARAARL